MTPKFPKISLDPVNSTQIARVQRERTGLTNSTTRQWLSRSGLQLFLYVEVSEFVCLPGRSYLYKIPAGLLRRLHRSRRTSLPLRAPDILSARLQAERG